MLINSKIPPFGSEERVIYMGYQELDISLVANHVGIRPGNRLTFELYGVLGNLMCDCILSSAQLSDCLH